MNGSDFIVVASILWDALVGNVALGLAEVLVLSVFHFAEQFYWDRRSWLKISLGKTLMANDDEVRNDRVVEARARNISHNVRCTECGSQSIEDSQADIAILLRKVHLLSVHVMVLFLLLWNILVCRVNGDLLCGASILVRSFFKNKMNFVRLINLEHIDMLRLSCRNSKH